MAKVKGTNRRTRPKSGYKKQGNKTAFTVCDIGANIVQVMCAGDFVLFGPIENAKIAFPAVAQTDMFICEAAADMGTV